MSKRISKQPVNPRLRKIKALMLQFEISQKILSVRSGVPASHLSRLLSGIRGIRVSDDTLTRLENAMEEILKDNKAA
jgi:transcriptional regulator with XRE-family HTH domain